MNWIQQNKKLAGIFGVMIAGGLGLGVWLFLNWSDFSAAQAEWESLSQKTTVLENSKVYPSDANVKALEQKIGDYRDKFATLRKVLLDPKLQQPVKPISETEFQAKIKERAKAVKQKADEAGTRLPDKFALAFEEYSDTLPPNAEVAAELNVHLDVMEKLVMTLVNSKVTALDSLERSRLPGEKSKQGAAPAPAPAPAGRRGPALPPPPAVEQVLDRYTIKCIFTSDQGPLQGVLNTLSNAAKMPDFLAVRLMRVENEKTEAPTKDEIRNSRPQGEPAAASPSATPKEGEGKPAAGANVILTPKPLPPDAKAVIGAEVLKVYLEIDYIRFRQPAPESPPARKA